VLDLEHVRELLNAYGSALDVAVEPFEVGGVRFDFAHQRYVMGVVNLSTDSRNQSTVCKTPEEAFARGQRLIQDGAHIIDVGAESTRQYNERVSPRAQIERLAPVVEHYTRHGVVTSIDTYYPEVLEACAALGARIFNLTGARDADAAFELAARYDAAVVICYIQGETPRDGADYVTYDDMVPVMTDYFAALLERARRFGATKCIIDPGLGFHYPNLSDDQPLGFQLEVLMSTFRFQKLGCPMLNVLPWAPTIFGGLGLEAEVYCVPIGWLGGAHILRTHAVKEAVQILRILEACRPRRTDRIRERV
jgi:dihydropteroate synthase